VDECVEIRSFKDWLRECTKVLLDNNRKDWQSLFFEATTFRKRGATAQIYIEACSNGIDMLKNFIEELRQQN